MVPRLDCIYYLGEKPCRFKRLCLDCPHYKAKGIRILILKLGAMGDALRTTPLLHALKRRFKQSSISWVTDRQSYPVLLNNPLIDSLLINSFEHVFPLTAQRFDVLLSLDKDPSVTSLAMKVDAVQRLGFAMSPFGTLDIFNDASRYALMLGLDDDLKFFKNQKTYQEIIHDIAEVPYARDPYIYNLMPEDETEANQIVQSLSAPGQGPAIGLNTGCGDVFATKKWPDRHFMILAGLLRDRLDARVYLLGGKAEDLANRALEASMHNQVVYAGYHSLGIFAALLKQMNAVVASDTMALHLALAVGSHVIGLFGPTCAQEIDFYQMGEPIVVADDCSPCYRKNCCRDISCMHDISPEQVFNSIEKFVNRRDN